MSNGSNITGDQLYAMIESFKKDLKGDLGEIKGDLKSLKDSITNTTIALGGHENRIDHLEKGMKSLQSSEDFGKRVHHNLQQWVMILIALAATICSIISIFN